MVHADFAAKPNKRVKMLMSKIQEQSLILVNDVIGPCDFAYSRYVKKI